MNGGAIKECQKDETGHGELDNFSHPQSPFRAGMIVNTSSAETNPTVMWGFKENIFLQLPEILKHMNYELNM